MLSLNAGTPIPCRPWGAASAPIRRASETQSPHRGGGESSRSGARGVPPETRQRRTRRPAGHGCRPRTPCNLKIHQHTSASLRNRPPPRLGAQTLRSTRRPPGPGAAAACPARANGMLLALQASRGRLVLSEQDYRDSAPIESEPIANQTLTCSQALPSSPGHTRSDKRPLPLIRSPWNTLMIDPANGSLCLKKQKKGGGVHTNPDIGRLLRFTICPPHVMSMKSKTRNCLKPPCDTTGSA